MNELQRDMKYYVDEEKADTEPKIAMKKDAIQSSDESIQLYKDEQKSLQEKLQKLNEKQQDLAMKWKKRCRHWLAKVSPESRRTPFLSRQRVATLGFLVYPRFC